MSGPVSPATARATAARLWPLSTRLGPDPCASDPHVPTCAVGTRVGHARRTRLENLCRHMAITMWQWSVARMSMCVDCRCITASQ